MFRRQLLFRCRLLPILLLLAACADGDSPTEMSERTLKPYGTLIDETFTSVSHGLLRGDILFVADEREKKVMAINLLDGSSRTIGRKGTGPGEFQMPRRILPWRGDSIVLWDFRTARTTVYTVWSPDLEYAREFRLDGFYGSPIGSTLDGELYLSQSPPYDPHKAQATTGIDSLRLLRVNVETENADTVAAVAGSRWRKIRRTDEAAHQIMELVIPEPFSETEAWGASIDRVVIVRPRPMQFDIITRAGSRKGPVIHTPPVTVTDADKALFLGLMLTDDWDWPAVKPPFPTSNLLVANKYTFLEVSAPAGTRTYFAIDEHGAAAFKFTVPMTQQLIAANNDVLVFTDRDEFDVLRMRAYRI